MDFLRVSACFMVMLIHSTEPFYLGGDGGLILSATDAFWVALFEGASRCCVPLFLIASSYLQFPLHYSTGEFFRRRALRILVPMAVWTLVYALAWGQPVANLKGLLLNFNYAAGHLWFVYMLVGIYLVMPLLSPWARTVSRRELEVYLGIWLLTTLFPFVREAAGGVAPIIQAADGLPAPALFPLWGEASWNAFGMFYYLSGFIGYMLLGLYLRRFVRDSQWTRFLGWALFLAGFVAIVSGLLRRFSATGDGFPIAGDLAIAVSWETPINFCGLPVVLTAVGLMLVFRQASFREGRFYSSVILPLSKAGYGMYLIHMLVLARFSVLFRNLWGLGSGASLADGVLGASGVLDTGGALSGGGVLDVGGAFGVWTTPVQILATALSSFVVVGLVAILLQRIPKVGKYLMG